LSEIRAPAGPTVNLKGEFAYLGHATYSCHRVVVASGQWPPDPVGREGQTPSRQACWYTSMCSTCNRCKITKIQSLIKQFSEKGGGDDDASPYYTCSLWTFNVYRAFTRTKQLFASSFFDHDVVARTIRIIIDRNAHPKDPHASCCGWQYQLGYYYRWGNILSQRLVTVKSGKRESHHRQ
jgi:hypothetical protein